MRDFIRMLLCLLPLLSAVACGGDGDTNDESVETSSSAIREPTSASTEGSGVTIEGFAAPESVLHDTSADIYLVSNIDGDPGTKDGTGFISRVSPVGEILELRWIDGGTDGVTLNAPKGLGLLGDTVVVADLDVVRLFDRTTGEPIGSWPVEGATFLNDVAVGPGGAVYVSDSGVRFTGGQPEDTGTSAIHVFSPDGSHRTLDTGGETGINGLAAVGSRLYGVTMGTGKVFLIENGVLSELPELPGLNLDGLIVMDDGLLISDWDTETVYLLRENGSISAVVRNVTSPADIGIDRKRNRLLIPGLMTGQVLLAPLRG